MEKVNIEECPVRKGLMIFWNNVSELEHHNAKKELDKFQFILVKIAVTVIIKVKDGATANGF